MKIILPGLIFALMILPQASFAANQTITPAFVSPQQATCNQQVDAETKAFWAQQGEELQAFVKANPNSMAQHDKHFHAMLALNAAARTGQSTAGLQNPPEDPAFAIFLQKEIGEKSAFLAKMTQDRQDCLKL